MNEGGYTERREVYGYVHKGRKHPLHKPQRKANGSHETTHCYLSSGTMHVHKKRERERERESEKRKEKVCGGGSKMEDIQRRRERPKRVETTEVKTERNQNRDRLETVLNHSSFFLSLSLSLSLFLFLSPCQILLPTTTSFQIATLRITPTTDRRRYTESGHNFELSQLPVPVL